jgi:predicted DNA-binding transcriptional regulator AlpA
MFGLTPEAIYNRRHRGDFPPAIKVGASLRWRVKDVESWLEAHRDGEASQ